MAFMENLNWLESIFEHFKNNFVFLSRCSLNGPDVTAYCRLKKEVKPKNKTE